MDSIKFIRDFNKFDTDMIIYNPDSVKFDSDSNILHPDYQLLSLVVRGSQGLSRIISVSTLVLIGSTGFSVVLLDFTEYFPCSLPWRFPTDAVRVILVKVFCLTLITRFFF